MEENDELTTQPSLRDTISALVDQTEAGEPLVAPVEVKIEADAPVAPAAAEDPAKPGRTEGRARAPDGKLLPGKAVRTDAVVSPPSPPAAIAPAAAAPALQRPSSWKKDYEPHWTKLATGQPLTPEESRAIAEYAIQRENDAARGVSTYKTEWDNAKPVLDAVAPFLPDLQKHGIAPADMVGRLMAGHKQLALGSPQERLAMFGRLMQDYTVPAKLAVQDAQGNWQLLADQPIAPQPQQPQFQPQDIRKLVQEQLQTERTHQSVQEFAAAKDDAGNPRYPHYDTVRQDMALLLDAGKAQDLDSAYKMSLRLHDDLWQAQQAAEAKAAEAARIEAQRAAVRTAKGNAVSVRSATPATRGGGATKSLRETIEDAVESVEGRV